MASNTAQFDLIINALGNLSEAIKDTNKLNTELLRGTKITRDAAKATDELAGSNKRAAAAAAEHDYKQSQGLRGTASSGRNMSKLAQTISGGPNSLVAAYATLAANAFAVSATFNKLKEIQQVEQLMKGLEAQGNRTGHTLSVVADNMRALTKFSVGAGEAMKATAQASAAGISTADIEKLTKVATNASIALGRNVPDSLNRLILGVAKGEPELVDELGLTVKMTEAQAIYARQIHKTVESLTQYEKQQALLNAWVAQGELKFSGMADAVDTNPYDKLSASFSNLGQTVGNFINSAGVVGFVDFLSKDNWALGAAIVFFASTIKNTLLPVFSQAAEAAHKASLAKQGDLANQQESLATTLAELEAEKALNAERLAGLKVTTAGRSRPANYTKWEKLASSTDAAEREQAKGMLGPAQTSLKNYIDKLEAEKMALEEKKKSALKSAKMQPELEWGKVAERHTAEIAEKDALIAANEKVLANTKNHAEQEEALLTKISNKEQEAATLSKQTRMAKLEGMAQEGRANAVQALSAGKVSEATQYMTLSTRAYNEALAIEAALKAEDNIVTNGQTRALALYNEQLAITLGESEVAIVTQTGFSKALQTLKAALFGAGTGVKALGATVLEWLPMVGLAMLAVDLLSGAWNTLSEVLDPVGTKMKKSMEDFNKILESTKGKQDALVEMQKSMASASDIAIASLSNQAATVTELLNAYDKVRQSAIAAKEEQKSKGQIPINQVSVAMQGPGGPIAPYMATKSTGESVFGTSTKVAEAAGAAYDKLKISLPETTDKLLLANKTWKQFLDMPVEDRVKAFDTNLLSLADTESKVEAATKALNKSALDLNTGYTDFIKSLTTTTPYDTILVKVKSFGTAAADLKKNLAKLGAGASKEEQDKFSSQFASALTSLKGDARHMFTVDLQFNMDRFDEVQQRIQELSKKTNRSAGENEELKTLSTQRKGLETSITGELEKQIKGYSAQLSKNQALSIINQGDLAIAQANLAVIQKRGIVTGKNAVDELKAQNRIIELQQNELQIKAITLKIDLQKATLSLDELDRQTKLLDTYTDITKQLDKQTELKKQSSLVDKMSSGKATAAEKEEYKTSVAKTRLLDMSPDARTKAAIAERKKQIEGEMAAEKAGLTLLEKQSAALGMGKSSSAEQAAAYSKAELKLSQNKAEVLRNINELNDTRITSENQIANILSGSTETLNNELSIIRRSSELRVNAANEETKYKLDELRIELALANAHRDSGQATYYKDMIDLTERKNNATIKGIRSEEQLQTLDKIAIKSVEERLQLEKDILDVKSKILDASKEAQAADAELAEARASYEDKISGTTETTNTEKLKAAREAYKIAVEEADLKKAMIHQEFVLLKEKRAQFEQDQRTAISTLEKKLLTPMSMPSILSGEDAPSIGGKSGKSPAEDTIIAENKPKDQSAYLAQWQAHNTVLNASKAANMGMAHAEDAATAAVDKHTEALRTNIKTMSALSPLTTKGFMESYRNQQARFEAVKTQNEGKSREETNKSLVTFGFSEASKSIDDMKEKLKDLGPRGALVTALEQGAFNISAAFVDAFRIMEDSANDSKVRTVAALQVTSAMIETVSQTMKASAQVKTASIDREIAAEEKRDGHSAQSIAKIDALNKQKDAIQKKAFETDKKMQMAQAIISTASGMAQALELGPLIGPPLAAMIGVMGAAQLAVIASTQYQSEYTPMKIPQQVSIGTRGDTVNLANGPSANAGGEAGYITGAEGVGTSASTYRTVGSAYGGDLTRGYGNRGFVVGEKGPEVISPDTPINVTPASDINQAQPINANIAIHAIDAKGVQDILVSQRGNIIKMLRDAANANGKTFMENVNTNVYTRPGVERL